MSRVFSVDAERLEVARSTPAGSLDAESGAAKLNLSETQWRWIVLASLLLTTILYFVKLGARALWASEFRWAEIAREMSLTHRYFWPTINGRLYFDKPLGSYWLVLAASWITGRIDEAATRIPSAAAATVAVALLIVLTRRLYDRRTGVAAGFILATSFSFAFWARTASADIETVAGELATLMLFAKYRSRASWWVVPMWSVMALTSLMKGLLGFVLPITVIGVYSFIADGWQQLESGLMHGPLRLRIHWIIERNRWFLNWQTAVAVPLAALIYCVPFAISYADSGSVTGMYMVYRENIERYFAPFDHRGPIYLYVYVIIGLMAPWSAFLPAALVYGHTRIRTIDRVLNSDRFVLAFFWATFVFFTLSGSRRSYYILPILPAASILVARVFVVPEQDLSELTRLLVKGGFALVVMTLALSGIILLPPTLILPRPYSFLPILPRRAMFAICWIVSLGTAAYASIRYSRIQMLIAVSVASYVVLLYLFIVAMPAADQWRGEKQFAQETRSLIDGHPAELASFKVQPPMFYLGLSEPVPEYSDLSQLESDIRSGPVKWVILRRRDISALKLPAHPAAFQPTYPWDSREHRLNALVLMKLER
jgi:4-amino-4-deoxy-L-arabinose transferase-like glycosyltransferase